MRMLIFELCSSLKNVHIPKSLRITDTEDEKVKNVIQIWIIKIFNLPFLKTHFFNHAKLKENNEVPTTTFSQPPTLYLMSLFE